MRRLKVWTIKVICLVVILSVSIGCAQAATPATRSPNAATGAVGKGAYDAVTKLQNQVSELPDSAFSDANSRGTILKEIKAVADQVEAGANNGAIDKLDISIKDKVQKWVASAQQAPLLTSTDIAVASITNASETMITVSAGRLAGADAGNNSWVWKGVPYAKPPVGALRWKAPINPDPWQKVRHSTDNFTPALQPNMLPTWIPTNQVAGSEDCLYLNVFRPKAAAKNLPVLIWMHGGANYFGGADKYDGSLLASKMNMIVVVLQYRLGPLGFLAHPALNPAGTPEDKSGNYGTLDSIQALKWVKGNIAAFGGNPGNVTVSGQSAGGFNTLNLVISPLAAGLFNKAFSLSAGGRNIPVATGVARANAVIEKLLVLDGTCADAAAAASYRAAMTNEQTEIYLRGKPGDLVERAAMNARGSIDAAGPVIDGYVLQGTAADIIATGNYNKVPIVLGSTEYELKPFLPLYGVAIPTSTTKTWFNSFNVLGVLPPPMALTDVFGSQGDQDLYEACGKYPSLSWKAAAVDGLAHRLKDKQGDVYCYWFKWDGVGSDTPGFDFIYGAGHATDIPFFFGWDRDVYFLKSFSTANQQGRLALQDAMMSYLGQFAATGNPNKTGSGLPVWEQWSNAPGSAKSITFDASAATASIGMMNLEITRDDVMAQIDALDPKVKAVVKMFLFF